MSRIYTWVITNILSRTELVQQQKQSNLTIYLSHNTLQQGANSHGQLGLGFTSELCSLPVPLPTPPGLCADDVIEISGGGGHVLLLTRTGAVFACGWNNRGQLGSDGTASTECKTRLTAIDVQHFDAHMVCTVRAGWDCSAVITTTGDVFVWGSNVYGLLGGDRRDVRWSDVPRFVLKRMRRLCLKFV